ncbi:MAG: hypothetical protein Q4P78_02415 [Rothia sp. (in: high G+C Gram-positive bacteria)]|uniref:hypothetical protein n=1 Tax=Rothia sp. (in: high G+C Gram-positive bacteria) TaxID=1885016 RepID=UPI0026DF949C|nr:hypothetical protein [Rothia sp. (in: high G+C Gram-positive bacteria)]MDO5750041.1 hypothetical protein [Rothia sp. (in: high G+C Gram-positive bacteria)]
MTQNPNQGYGYDSAAPQLPAPAQPVQQAQQPVQVSPVESVSAPLTPAPANAAAQNATPQPAQPQPAPAYTEQPSAPLTVEQPTGTFIPNPYALQGTQFDANAPKQKTPPATAHYIMAGLIGLAILLVYIVPVLPIASGGLFGVNVSLNWFTDTSSLDESNPYTPMAMVTYVFNTVLLLFVILFVALRNTAMRITTGIIAIVWGLCHMGFGVLMWMALSNSKSSSSYGALMSIGPSFPVLALTGLIMTVAGILMLLKFSPKNQSVLPIQPIQQVQPVQTVAPVQPVQQNQQVQQPAPGTTEGTPQA